MTIVRRFIVALMLTLGAQLPAFSDDTVYPSLKLEDGSSFENARVARIEGEMAVIVHKSGVARVKTVLLPSQAASNNVEMQLYAPLGFISDTLQTRVPIDLSLDDKTALFERTRNQITTGDALLLRGLCTATTNANEKTSYGMLYAFYLLEHNRFYSAQRSVDWLHSVAPKTSGLSDIDWQSFSNTCSACGGAGREGEASSCSSCNNLGRCLSCGGTGRVQSRGQNPCGKCQGTGRYAGHFRGGVSSSCPFCSGSGYSTRSVFEYCSDCGGKGICSHCKGAVPAILQCISCKGAGWIFHKDEVTNQRTQLALRCLNELTPPQLIPQHVASAGLDYSSRLSTMEVETTDTSIRIADPGEPTIRRDCPSAASETAVASTPASSSGHRSVPPDSESWYKKLFDVVLRLGVMYAGNEMNLYMHERAASQASGMNQYDRPYTPSTYMFSPDPMPNYYDSPGVNGQNSQVLYPSGTEPFLPQQPLSSDASWSQQDVWSGQLLPDIAPAGVYQPGAVWPLSVDPFVDNSYSMSTHGQSCGVIRNDANGNLVIPVPGDIFPTTILRYNDGSTIRYRAGHVIGSSYKDANGDEVLRDEGGRVKGLVKRNIYGGHTLVNEGQRPVLEGKPNANGGETIAPVK